MDGSEGALWHIGALQAHFEHRLTSTHPAQKALEGILPCLFLFGRDEDIWSEGFCANISRRGKLDRGEAEFVAFQGGG